MSDELRAVRRQKLAQWRADGNAYPNDFKPSHSAAALHTAHGEKTREQLANENATAAVAGRIMLRRTMGAAAFLTVQDDGVRIQIYAARAVLGDKLFEETGHWDIGDIVGIDGELFKTKTGELTLRAQNIRLLVKSLEPPPEKFHGIADTETRYRRRHLSLSASSAEREVFVRRAAMIRRIREFFYERDYFEAETPILQPIPGGAAARPFITKCNALNCDFYLRIAQELYIKRLLAGGFNRVFELNRNFRNEGVSTRHNPEFTMLEFNAAYHTCEDFIGLTETLLNDVARTLHGGDVVRYQGRDLSFAPPFARLSPAAAILQHCPRYTPDDLQNESRLRDHLAEFGKTPPAAASVPELQFMLFEETAEPLLEQPTFIVDYPAAASPLARRRPDNPAIAERFELFVAGREIANGFSELNDPDKQAEIFRQQAECKAGGDNEAMHYDEEYIFALQCGLPPNAGGGIGIDRLAMLLTDSPSIRDVILFPQLRPTES